MSKIIKNGQIIDDGWQVLKLAEEQTAKAITLPDAPTLLPLESRNLDLALEWYFAPASYLSVTFFDKRVKNFIGNTQGQENLYGLRDPTSGRMHSSC